MDCRTARQFLEFTRPPAAELEPADAQALENHLADCPDCGPAARAERQFDKQLGQAMRAVPLPDGLRLRLQNRLTVERDAWYRRRLVRFTGLAAAVFLAVWLGWSLHVRQRTQVDLEQLVSLTVESRGANPEQVETAFRNQGVPMRAPTQLNFAMLHSFQVVEFHGRRVPELVFTSGPATARVLVLRDAQFDLRFLAEQVRAQTGGAAVEVLWHRDDPRVAYLVICTGGNLEEFLVHERPHVA